MSITRHIRPMCIGAAIGFLVAAAALASGDSPNQAAARVFDLLGTPVSLFVLLLKKLFGLGDASTVGVWLISHFVYWMLLGSGCACGISILRYKATGKE
jgi:hypothetical protein